MTISCYLTLFLSIWDVSFWTWLKACVWWWLKYISIYTFYAIIIIKIITSKTASSTIRTTWSSWCCRIPISIASCTLFTCIILFFKILSRTWISWTWVWVRLKEILYICRWNATFCTIICWHFTLFTTIHTTNTN